MFKKRLPRRLTVYSLLFGACIFVAGIVQFNRQQEHSYLDYRLRHESPAEWLAEEGSTFRSFDQLEWRIASLVMDELGSGQLNERSTLLTKHFKGRLRREVNAGERWFGHELPSFFKEYKIEKSLSIGKHGRWLVKGDGYSNKWFPQTLVLILALEDHGIRLDDIRGSIVVY